MAAKRKDKKTMTIDRELCKGCGICVAFYSKGVLALDDDEKAMIKYPKKCEECGMCELRCPDLAIERL